MHHIYRKKYVGRRVFHVVRIYIAQCGSNNRLVYKTKLSGFVKKTIIAIWSVYKRHHGVLRQRRVYVVQKLRHARRTLHFFHRHHIGVYAGYHRAKIRVSHRSGRNGVIQYIVRH